jgi:RimJ/RimL family protein N-acetyltransferase
MGETLPRFQTARLLVRPRTNADMEACVAMDRDPEVTRFIPGPWSDPVAHKAFFEAHRRRGYPSGMGYWSVLEENRFIGGIQLAPLDWRSPEIEIGWRFVRSAWGRGYATEALGPVLNYALQTLKAHEIVADIARANIASVRVAQKLGFRLLRSLDDDGQAFDRYVLTAELTSGG